MLRSFDIWTWRGLRFARVLVGHTAMSSSVCAKRLFFVAATLTFVAAQTPGVPHGGGACTTDFDCSLGGICNASTSACMCDPWFTGKTCALLNLQAPADDQGGTCGSGFDTPCKRVWKQGYEKKNALRVQNGMKTKV